MDAIDRESEQGKEYEAMYEAAKEITKEVNTWDGLYAFFARECAGYISNRSQLAAERTIALLLAFTIALRELPEEGDCVAILHKTLEIAIFRPDLTGIDMVGSKAEAEHIVRAILGAALLQTIAETVEEAKVDGDAAGTPPVPTPTTGKGFLH